jgi:hypothetical protein
VLVSKAAVVAVAIGGVDAARFQANGLAGHSRLRAWRRHHHPPVCLVDRAAKTKNLPFL